MHIFWNAFLWLMSCWIGAALTSYILVIKLHVLKFHAPKNKEFNQQTTLFWFYLILFFLMYVIITALSMGKYLQ
jgi:hypothetical protein